MGWQPIETAPRHGERVHVLANGIQFIAFFDDRQGEWCVCGQIYIDEPTHWMPLPEPPSDR